jgi:hypothetical protein
MVMEVVDIVLSENAHSHIEHLYIDLLIGLIGIIELLILFRVLWSPFFPFISGILWTFIGFFFTIHAQVQIERVASDHLGQLARSVDALVEYWPRFGNGLDVAWYADRGLPINYICREARKLRSS